MGSLGIGSRGHKHGMARPLLIDFIKGGIILSDDEHLVLVLLPCNTNQPVVEKRQVRLANCTNNHITILGHKRRRFSQCVLMPFCEGGGVG